MLEDATTAELVEELKKRFESVVIAGIRAGLGEDKDGLIYVSHTGGAATAIGLCSLVGTTILKDTLTAFRDAEDRDLDQG